MQEVLFILLLVAAGQGLFLAIFLSAAGKRISGFFLGLIFLFFSLQLFDLVLLYSGQALNYPHIAFLSMPFNLAFGPLLYLYILSNRKENRQIKPVQLWHFLPFLIHLVYIFLIYHLQDTDYKVRFIEQLLESRVNTELLLKDVSGLAFSGVMYIQFSTYLWLSHKKLRSADAFADIVLKWLNKVWLAVLVIGVFGFIQVLLLLLNVDQQPGTGYLASFLAVIYIYAGAVIVLRKPQTVFPPAQNPKYQYSTLAKTESEQLLDQLRTFMEQESPYKDQGLTLKQLALESGLPERHISQVINEKLDQNFSDFLNQYRVTEFKQRVSDPANDHLSILGLAMDCGFNSKTTFNTVFKKLTGQTPSQFRKQL